MCGIILGFSDFMPVLPDFDYCSFVVLSDVWEGYASSFVPFFSGLLWQFWVCYDSIKILELF